MRSLLGLSIAVAALASIACGAPPPDGGNVFVSEGGSADAALVMADGQDVDAANQPFRLVPVVIDESDPGCTVDGMRFGRCSMTRTNTVDVKGVSLSLCELEVDNGAAYTWECDVGHEAGTAVDRYQTNLNHCPEGG